MDAELIRKVGLRLGQKAATLHAPAGYAEFLHIPEPADTLAEMDDELDWIQAFFTKQSTLEAEIEILKKKITRDGQLWISWPKKSSGLSSTIDDGIVRKLGLQAGLVDVKVASINETWSGLKFVYRLSDR